MSNSGPNKNKKIKINSHGSLHLVECTFGLVKKSIYNTLAEVAIGVIIIHFENLFKGGLVDGVTHVGKLRRSILLEQKR